MRSGYRLGGRVTMSMNAEQKSPFVFRILWYVLLLAVGVAAATLTLIVFYWRHSETPALILIVFLIETLFLIYIFSFGRKHVDSVIAGLYRLIKSSPAKVIAVLVLLVFVLFMGWPTAGQQSKAAKKFAVVGAGAGGAHAAWVLHQAGYDVTLYEAANYVGGHAHAFDFETSGGKTIPYDIGFMWGGVASYKEMKALLAYYNVRRQISLISFYSKVNGTEWTTDDGGPLKDQVNRFHTLAERDAENPAMNLLSFGRWLDRHDFSKEFKNKYLTPLLALFFLTSDGLYESSTRFVIKLLAGHQRMAGFKKAERVWTLPETSRAYYTRMTQSFKHKIKLKSPVTKIERNDGKVQITFADADGKSQQETYDKAILTAPADVIKEILDTTWYEALILSQVRYRTAEMVVHTDSSVLPKDGKARLYNYIRHAPHVSQFDLTVRLSQLRPSTTTVVPEPLATFNPQRELKNVLFRKTWRHYIMDMWHLATAHELLPRIQGRDNVYYAGSWAHFAGHGNAAISGIKAACMVADVTKVAKETDANRCVDVREEDPRDDADKGKTIKLCGKGQVFEYVVRRSCAAGY